MKKPIAIVAGEPNSISSEIIFKSWSLKKKYKHNSFFIIGNIKLLNNQMEKLKYKIKIKRINNNFKITDLKSNYLPVYNVDYKQKKPFEQISSKSNKYIFKCFDIASKFANKKKILGFINCPIAKEYLFKKKHQGITEYLAKKENNKNNSVMLIYNKELSVSPITTHIPINKVIKNISSKKIIQNVKIISSFYRKYLKKKANFAILGLNPHSYYFSKKSREKKIMDIAVKTLNKLKINAKGPVSSDSSFVNYKKNKFEIIIGMYHDQVLAPFKALYTYKAINITLGLPYIRVSPDHGVANDITGKKVANPNSLIESIKFFNLISI